MSKEDFVGGELLEYVRVSEYPFIVDGNTIGLPFNLQDMIFRFGKNIIPNELGIYHLFNNDQLIYVGMSKKLRGRLLGHIKDKDMPFNNCLWFCAEKLGEGYGIKEVLDLEYKMIKKFKPILNSVHANCR